jgi:hypothetical protein
LLSYKPAVRGPIDPKILSLITFANSKFPLEPKHAMTYLNNVITHPIEKIEIMAYDVIHYYYINADMEDSYDIGLRKRIQFLSL